MQDSILVTGAAGFIGFHVAKRLLDEGQNVVGVDNLNQYYDPRLKEARLSMLLPYPTFTFVRTDVADRAGIAQLFAEHAFRLVVHLAAQAGVRYSLENPYAYVDSNLQGFITLLEGCRQVRSEHLVFASSSSVYGLNSRMPFSEHDRADHPISLYAATKRANELMAHSYAHLYALPCTGLRFFTVYGPWGRPDMALFSFARKILAGEPIELYNGGKMRRDYTFVEDVVEGVVRVLHKPPTSDAFWDCQTPDSATSAAPYRLYNVGCSTPVDLFELVRTLEEALGREADIRLSPIQAGDVVDTYADVEELENAVDYRPATPIREGIERFVQWYRADQVGRGSKTEPLS